jgi:DNA-binding transcriptional regulator YiaG
MISAISDTPAQNARALYHEVEEDLLAVIDIASFMSECLDGADHLSNDAISGMRLTVMALRDRALTVKGAFLKARGDV